MIKNPNNAKGYKMKSNSLYCQPYSVINSFICIFLEISVQKRVHIPFSNTSGMVHPICYSTRCCCLVFSPNNISGRCLPSGTFKSSSVFLTASEYSMVHRPWLFACLTLLQTVPQWRLVSVRAAKCYCCQL